MSERRKQPKGRDEVVPAVLAACERLCERSVPTNFTIIELAAEARITTSLLYFYFDSKESIVRQTLLSIASDVDTLAAQYSDPDDMVEAVRALMWRRPAFPRIVTALAIEGRDVTKLMGSHPLLQRLVKASSDRGDSDPETFAGRAILDILSTATIGPAINHALGRDPYDPRIVDGEP